MPKAQKAKATELTIKQATPKSNSKTANGRGAPYSTAGARVEAGSSNAPIVIQSSSPLDMPKSSGKSMKSQIPAPQMPIQHEPRPQAAAIEPLQYEPAEAEAEDQIHPKAADRLSRADGMLSGLSKRFLKDVQQQLGVYGGGTNSDMADGILEHLEEVMNSGGSLKEELSIISSVHEECYPSCAYDDEDAASSASD